MRDDVDKIRREVERLKEPPFSAAGECYLVQATGGGPIKVGFSVDMRRRLMELQTGSPFPLRIVSTILAPDAKFDRRIHSALPFASRSAGEWFHPGENVVEILEQIGFATDDIRGKLSSLFRPASRAASIAASQGIAEKRGRRKPRSQSELLDDLARENQRMFAATLDGGEGLTAADLHLWEWLLFEAHGAIEARRYKDLRDEFWRLVHQGKINLDEAKQLRDELNAVVEGMERATQNSVKALPLRGGQQAANTQKTPS